MRSTEEALINFFKQVALKNNTLLSEINTEQCFDVDNEKWKFTVPNLHSFLQKNDPAFSSIDYLTFRKTLFNSLINQTVKDHGAELLILDNQKNVDRSVYTLVWNS
jgi:hypothetical protein